MKYNFVAPLNSCKIKTRVKQVLCKSNTSQAHVRLDVFDEKEGVNVRGRDLPNNISISKEYKYQTADKYQLAKLTKFNFL